ncbi:MAG: hypothetical protein GF320_08480 [Armatimonadia bacterium]|nr:hypothetical protein [Armatimonadia bacterium]
MNEDHVLCIPPKLVERLLRERHGLDVPARTIKRCIPDGPFGGFIDPNCRRNRYWVPLDPLVFDAFAIYRQDWSRVVKALLEREEGPMTMRYERVSKDLAAEAGKLADVELVDPFTVRRWAKGTTTPELYHRQLLWALLTDGS